MGKIFAYNITPLGEAVITGITAPCRKVVIPEKLDGYRVIAARISSAAASTGQLQELVTEGPVLFDFDFRMESLERIDLHPNTVLVRPPHGVVCSRWYSQQEGQVYLQNWFCGSQGVRTKEVLVLEPGTVGVIAGSDRDYGWQKVVFPAAVQYIGSGAFGNAEMVYTYRKIRQRVFLAAEGTEYRVPLHSGFHGKQLYNFLNCIPEISWEFMASVPEFTYDAHDGWKARVQYQNENGIVGYEAWIWIPSGKVESVSKWNDPPESSIGGIWTEVYTTPFYLLSGRYLEIAARVICSGEPPADEVLAQLKAWRMALNP